MLLAADLDRAAKTLEAMAAISCLRGGVAAFDANLDALGWYEPDDDWGCNLWVPVPDESEFADCRLKIEVALDEARRGATEMIDGLDDARLPLEFQEFERARLRDFVERLEVA